MRTLSIIAGAALALAISILPAGALRAEEAAAARVADLGPAVGAEIPHSLSAKTAFGDAADFNAMSGDKGIALFFVRSVDWCPYCQAQAIDVNERAAEFEERGLNVVFLSYDTPEKQQKFIAKREIKPVVISDHGAEIIQAFGLLNKKYDEGSRYFGIPYPAVFVINADKQVAAKLYEEDYAVNDKSYRNRPAVDIILDAIDEAAGEGRL